MRGQDSAESASTPRRPHRLGLARTPRQPQPPLFKHRGHPNLDPLPARAVLALTLAAAAPLPSSELRVVPPFRRPISTYKSPRSFALRWICSPTPPSSFSCLPSRAIVRRHRRYASSRRKPCPAYHSTNRSPRRVSRSPSSLLIQTRVEVEPRVTDSGHRQRARRRWTHQRLRCQASPSALGAAASPPHPQIRSKPESTAYIPVNHGGFAKEPLAFLEIKPRSMPVQKNF